MMKHLKKLTLMIVAGFLSLCMSNSLFADDFEWAPEGAEWYHSAGQNFAHPSFFKFVKLKDSIFHDSINVSVIQLLAGGQLTVWDTFYTFHKNQKVFVYLNDTFVRLYDFNAIPGDTLNLPVDPAKQCIDSPFIHVIDTGSTEINNKKLKTLFVEYHFVKDETTPILDTIIERVGGKQNGLNILHAIQKVCDGYSLNFINYYGTLRCYEDDNFPKYISDDFGLAGPWSDLPCDYEVVSIDENHKKNISFSVSPNPVFKGKLDVTFSTLADVKKISLFNIAGQKKWSETYNVRSTKNFEFTTPELQDGIYFLMIETSEGFYRDRIILQNQN